MLKRSSAYHICDCSVHLPYWWGIGRERCVQHHMSVSLKEEGTSFSSIPYIRVCIPFRGCPKLVLPTTYKQYYMQVEYELHTYQNNEINRTMVMGCTVLSGLYLSLNENALIVIRIIIFFTGHLAETNLVLYDDMECIMTQSAFQRLENLVSGQETQVSRKDTVGSKLTKGLIGSY